MKKKNITFDEFFQSQYQDRWPELREALLKENCQVIRPSFGAKELSESTDETVFGYQLYTEKFKGIDRELNDQCLRQYYIMDSASIICAKSLEVEPGDFVLDMCAAPGGKSLILAESVGNGEIWLNEISQARREKLKGVIQAYAPEAVRKNIFIKGKDGGRYGLMHPEKFDKILIDAPCSGEKHLLHSPSELENWNEKRTKRLSKTQFTLICSGLLALKPGGQMVYSTCSISPYENDQIIQRLLERKGDQVELDLPELNLEGIERTEFGYIFLPDRSPAGPIYFSRLRKK